VKFESQVVESIKYLKREDLDQESDPTLLVLGFVVPVLSFGSLRCRRVLQITLVREAREKEERSHLILISQLFLGDLALALGTGALAVYWIVIVTKRKHLRHPADPFLLFEMAVLLIGFLGSVISLCATVKRLHSMRVFSADRSSSPAPSEQRDDEDPLVNTI
jgi:hypothetical protein